jgi:pimeloyl-ACP methyl ester carboxylesterase
MVHGIPGSGRDFRHLAPWLSPVFRVIRLDLPGFGGSAPEAGALVSFEGRARVVRDLADHLGLARFAVLGHSMGGGTALALAAQAPDRVSLLALVASLGLRLHRGLGLPAAVFRWLGRALSTPGLGHALDPLARGVYRRRRLPVDELSRDELARQVLCLSAADFGRLRALAARPLPRTLVAYAEDDHMIETEISRELGEALPGARTLAFPSGGHNIQKTRAAELAGAIREELAGAG